MTEEIKTEEAQVQETKAEESSVTAPVNPLERTVEFTVSREAVAAATEARVRKYARTARCDGFRRGHVPMNIVQGMYGEQAYSEALNEEISKAVDKALTEGKFRVAGTPEVAPAKDMPTDGKSDYKFEAKFEVFPEIEAPKFDGVEMKRFTCEVTDKEVEQTIEVMRKQRTSYEAADRASEKDDRVTCDFEGKLDGVAFEGGAAKDFIFVIGSGQMLPEFDVAATGMKAGDQKEFELTFPENYGAKNLAGKKTVFTITMKTVEAPKVPALDDDFAKSLGVAEGAEALKKEVEANLKREVKSRLTARTKEGVFDKLLELSKFDLPKCMVQDEAEHLAADYQKMMLSRIGDPKQVPQFEAKMFEPQADKRVRLGLVVSKLISENQIKSEPEQVKALAAELAAAYENPAEVTEWYLKDSKHYAELSAAVIENNLIDFILGQCKTADEAVEFDKLMGRA